MGRAVGALLVFVGGNSFAIWLQNRNVPDWFLATVWVGSFGGAAVILWWQRWAAAWAAFWHPNQQNAAPDQTREGDDKARDKKVSLDLFDQGREAIVLRDTKVVKVNDFDGLIRVERDYGSWYGRNRYIAEQYIQRFPDEANRFITHGKADLVFANDPDPVLKERNRLAALLTVRAEALRLLAKVINDRAGS